MTPRDAIRAEMQKIAVQNGNLAWQHSRAESPEEKQRLRNELDAGIFEFKGALERLKEFDSRN